MTSFCIRGEKVNDGDDDDDNDDDDGKMIKANVTRKEVLHRGLILRSHQHLQADKEPWGSDRR